jgi:hypothetical protein
VAGGDGGNEVNGDDCVDRRSPSSEEVGVRQSDIRPPDSASEIFYVKFFFAIWDSLKKKIFNEYRIANF